MSVSSDMEKRLQMLALRIEEQERNNIRLEKKVDNANRNIVTAATIGGAVVGAIAGVGFIAYAGWVPPTASVAKATAIYLGGAAGGGAAGAGIGYGTGEVLVNTKLGEKKV
jgi:hypothetical protein